MSSQVRETAKLSSRARRVFLSMASPFGFGSDPKLFCSLDTVNLPPMMGRADAAFEAALRIVEDSAFFDLSDEDRLDRYRMLRTLFGCARENSEALAVLRKSGKRISFDELAQAYGYLERLGGVLFDLLQCQLDAMSFSGRTFGRSPTRPETVSADPELDIFRLMKDFLLGQKNEFDRLRGDFKKLLPAQELERYSKAYTEFTSFYAAMSADKPSDDK